MHRNGDTRLPFASLVALTLVVGTAGVWMLLPFALPVVMGGLLASVVRPAYGVLRLRGWGRRRAAAGLAAGLTLLVALPFALIATVAVREGAELARFLLSGQDWPLRKAARSVESWPVLSRLPLDAQEIERGLRESLGSAAQAASGAALVGAKNLSSVLLTGALIVLSCFFLLVDGEDLLAWAARLLPLGRALRGRLGASFRGAAASVLRASVLAAAAQACVVLLGFAALRVPGGALATAATFLLAYVPFVGCAPVILGAVVYLAAKGATGKAVAMLAVGAVTGTVDNLVRSLVMRGERGLHPLVGLVAILSGLKLFGFLGIFLGPVLLSVLLVLLDAWPPALERALNGRRRGLAAHEHAQP